MPAYRLLCTEEAHVPEDSTDELLGDKRHITLVLRLVVHTGGTLMHGEIGDLGGKTRGRFAAWDNLAASVQAVLAEHGR